MRRRPGFAALWAALGLAGLSAACCSGGAYCEVSAVPRPEPGHYSARATRRHHMSIHIRRDGCFEEWLDDAGGYPWLLGKGRIDARTGRVVATRTWNRRGSTGIPFEIRPSEDGAWTWPPIDEDPAPGYEVLRAERMGP